MATRDEPIGLRGGAAGRLCLGLLLAGCAAPSAEAGWESLREMPAPARDGDTLVFRSSQGAVAIAALSPHVVRFRFAPSGVFARDHSYAVVTRSLGPASPILEIRPDRSTLTTAALRVVASQRPFRVAFQRAGGEPIAEDDPEHGVAQAGSEVRVSLRLLEQDRVYGFGEKGGRLDKRGVALGGAAYAMWNTDAYGYDASSDPLYASVPFFMVLRGGRAHGIFLDNSWRSFFDVGKESRDRLSFGADGGELDYYLIDGPTPKQVIERYAELTGRMPLPPRWALGYHQCRYSYYPEARVREVAGELRRRGIPADVIWLDIHYLDGFNPFTWNRERFPDPARLIADLRGQGFRVVTIVDPHPKKQPGWPVYDSLVAGGHFVRNPDGSPYEGDVWPSRAEHDPAPSLFPDFSRAATRDWWGEQFRPLVEAGVAGIWNDMNEPAVFRDPSHTMPLDVVHDNEGEPADHRAIHNVYGMLMTRATFEGLLRLRPEARPFVLTRASFAGGQRYAALWPGDNTSDWSHMRGSLAMLLGMGLSGLPFVGSDIGGYAGHPSPELLTRWLQLGVFYPFMRNHTELGSPDQEPWVHGPVYEALNRRAIELRYELLPHLYNLLEEASRTGVPPLRPLLLEYPDDPASWGRDDQLLLGDDVLAAPVLREGQREREVYLPAGAWRDFWTGALEAGGRTLKRAAGLDSIPIFVRAGGFVFRQPAVAHTGLVAGQPLRVFVYPGAASARVLYEDDGDGFAYRRGGFARRRFSQRPDGAGVRVEAGVPEGAYRPAPRNLEFWVAWAADGPSEVVLDGRAVRAAEAARPAWRRDGGFVVVTAPDAPRVVTLELR